MKAQGVTIYLQAFPHQIMQRLKDETHTRPLLSDLDQPGLLFFIEQKLKEREPFYKQAKYIFNVDTVSIYSLSKVLAPKRN